MKTHIVSICIYECVVSGVCETLEWGEKEKEKGHYSLTAVTTLSQSKRNKREGPHGDNGIHKCYRYYDNVPNQISTYRAEEEKNKFLFLRN